MTGSERGARRPETYARLAAEAERTVARRTPPPWVRWLGIAICVLMALGVVAAIAGLDPW
ncbi:MAG: hypothetical protein QOD86_1013 [Miltoncostaeaceae bacterium]|nr:hypothetical protein [Miltoncostaeaceae bacterium]